MRLASSRSDRHLVATLAVAAMATAGLAALPALPASAAVTCEVTYKVVSQWPSGFQGDLVIKNTGDAWSSWTVTFAFPDGQTVTQGWGGKYSQSGSTVTVGNENWNGAMATGSSTNAGFLGSWNNATNRAPASFKVNGVTCGGVVVPTTTTTTTTRTTTTTTTSPRTTTTTTTSRTTTTTTTPPRTTTTTTTPPDNGVHVANPYVGKGYVNPEWKARAESVSGGSRVSNNPTAVWLDRIAAIAGTPNSQSNGSMGLRDHLDAALAQGAAYAQFVIYDLPQRDCSALASNGELTIDELPRYKSAYIDAIAAIEADAKYRNLRIVNIVEIDSLPNTITNLNIKECADVKSRNIYRDGIAYALGKLHAAGSNVYNYIDAAHHGWLGWDSNLGPSIDLFNETVKLAVGGYATTDGFIANTANYGATSEPYLGDINRSFNGTQFRSAKWIDWNQYYDELSYVKAFRAKAIGVGFPSGIGMLIDTSRNGWGGSARPTAASTSTDLNTFVNASKIDRRIHTGNWCNQSGAGIGARPTAAPSDGVDAYVWVKPPGESDGSSSLIPNSDGKGFDRMCDPTYGGNERNGNSATGALPNAPISGAWFAAQFAQLMQNAYPPLS
jgi:cellulose 1,4-beta-cellobiosidase